MSKLKSKNIQIVIIIFLILIVVFIPIFLIAFFNEAKNRFSPKKWAIDFDKRFELITDLEKNYLKYGMSKKQIIELLGEADGRYPDGANLEWKNELGYDLGIVFLDPCDYVITFDSTSKVKSFQMRCR